MFGRFYTLYVAEAYIDMQIISLWREFDKYARLVPVWSVFTIYVKRWYPGLLRHYIYYQFTRILYHPSWATKSIVFT